MRGIFNIIDLAMQESDPSGISPTFPRERFTGRFVNGMGVTNVVGFGDSLVLLNSDADDPTLAVTKLSVEDGDTLRMREAPGFASNGETIRYTRDESGTATKVVVGGISAYPLEVYLERSAADPT
jgi:hypothetical protein